VGGLFTGSPEHTGGHFREHRDGSQAVEDVILNKETIKNKKEGGEDEKDIKITNNN